MRMQGATPPSAADVPEAPRPTVPGSDALDRRGTGGVGQDVGMADRDVERIASVPEFVAKLRRLADALESGESFRIQVAGERFRVPKHAELSVEHERSSDTEEVELQLRWSVADAEADDSDGADV
jgi:amphi-Trp domain-containing protein